MRNSRLILYDANKIKFGHRMIFDKENMKLLIEYTKDKKIMFVIPGSLKSMLLYLYIKGRIVNMQKYIHLFGINNYMCTSYFRAMNILGILTITKSGRNNVYELTDFGKIVIKEWLEDVK